MKHILNPVVFKSCLTIFKTAFTFIEMDKTVLEIRRRGKGLYGRSIVKSPINVRSQKFCSANSFAPMPVETAHKGYSLEIEERSNYRLKCNRTIPLLVKGAYEWITFKKISTTPPYVRLYIFKKFIRIFTVKFWEA